jgi:hypothetical protein
MAKVIYKIVRHDGGWAYESGGTFSEPHRSKEEAHAAARLAAAEQSSPGESTSISYEDELGHWHQEDVKGNDRPETEVDG